MIRVVIADDHPQVRSALRHVLELEPDFEVVAEAEDGAQAVAAVVRTGPDLVILDYRMPYLNGVQVAEELRDVAPRTAMVMLTSEDDAGVRAAATRAGVARYLLKSGRADDLVRTLRAASTGHRLTVVMQGDSVAEEIPPTRIA